MKRSITAATRRARIDELDVWVLEELEALAQVPRTSPRAEATSRTKRVQSLSVVPRPDEARLGRELATPPAMIDPLDEEKARFIEQSAEWLRARPNADIILEELWTLVVAVDRDDATPADAGAVLTTEDCDKRDPKYGSEDEPDKPPGG